MPSRLNFCVNSLTPHVSKNKRHKPYFFTHVVTVALSSSKILTVGKLHWSLAIRMTTKTLMKQTSFVVSPSKYFKNTHMFRIIYFLPPSPKRRRRTVLGRASDPHMRLIQFNFAHLEMKNWNILK